MKRELWLAGAAPIMPHVQGGKALVLGVFDEGPGPFAADLRAKFEKNGELVRALGLSK